MPTRPGRLISLAALQLLLIPLLLALFSGAVFAGGGHVDVLTLADLEIAPPTADYLTSGIHAAASDGASAVIIQLDTPGGDLQSMKEIEQAILNSSVPVIVYVTPAGARAASAGTFITEAAQVAAMAPDTRIGAASPINADGTDISGTLGLKIKNDAISDITNNAARNHRNVAWAASAVSSASSITDTVALRIHAVDLISPNITTLLAQADGRTVVLNGGDVTVHTKGAALIYIPMSPLDQFLLLLIDPTVTFILFALAGIGIFFELTHPGIIAPGVVGVLSLLLALYSITQLPVNVIGVLLIIFAFVLFIADIKLTSHGILTIGGVISMLIGAFYLVNPGQPGVPAVQPIPVFVVTGVVALFFFYLVSRALLSRRWGVTTGVEGMIGDIATARTELAPDGRVSYRGEQWRAVSLDGALPAGSSVSIQSVEGLTLLVRRTPGIGAELRNPAIREAN